MIERRNFVYLGLRQPHFLRQRGQVRGRQMSVVILDPMQVLDQEISAAWCIAEQRANLLARHRVDRATLGLAPTLPAALVFRMYGDGLVLCHEILAVLRSPISRPDEHRTIRYSLARRH